MPGLALTDHNNLSGAVEFYQKATALGLKPIQGLEITMEDAGHLTLLAEDSSGYESLCQLLTAGFNNNECRVSWQVLEQYRNGLLALSGCRKSTISRALLRRNHDAARDCLHRLIDIFGKRQVFLESINTYQPNTHLLHQGLEQLHRESGIPLVATNNVHYVSKDYFPAHDTFVCTRTATALADIHPQRPFNQENYFASATEMSQRFKHCPQALTNSLIIFERCQPGLPTYRSRFPKFDCPPGMDSRHFLAQLVWAGAQRRYGVTTKAIQQRLKHELNIINQLGVADYFLAMWDIVQFAKKQRIQYAGRGSAADSAAAYCLEITNVDSIQRQLLFERFLSLERSQNPDIDIDFDASQRDRVAEYVYQKYGQEHAASVCTFATYRARSAIQDVGRAFGCNQNELRQLSKGIPHHVPADGIRQALREIPELKGHPLGQKKYHLLLDTCALIAGFPRHIGTHLGGMVISSQPLHQVTPLQPSAKGVRITQFDKDQIEALGLIKLDLLSLRTLGAVKAASQHLASQGTSYEQIPLDDPETFAMIRAGETVGAFQIESPAQRALQQRLQPDNIEDIVASIALIRPGPIQGNMVEPFIARRSGTETPQYIHPKLQPILEKTYGVVLYQEQVIEIASVIAGFTPGESDRLRRAMTRFRSQAEMDSIGEEFVEKAVANGVKRAIAETIFSYIQGYAGYGFCEAHAAAFSDTAYKTAYLLRHYPAHFYAALLNQQPIGFYPANSLCVQARNRGIQILPLDINESEAGFTADEHWIRIGLRQVKDMEAAQLQSILQTQKQAPFSDLADFINRTNCSRDVVRNLILAGAFDQLHKNRRRLLWQLKELFAHYGPTRQQSTLHLTHENDGAGISEFTPWQRFLHQYSVLQLSPDTHIMDFFRPQLKKSGVLNSKQLRTRRNGQAVMAGWVIRPHRPPTRSGRTIVFLTLEDECGLVDVTIFENIYRRFSKLIFSSPLLQISGEISQHGNHSSLTATHIKKLSFTNL